MMAASNMNHRHVRLLSLGDSGEPARHPL